LTSTNLNISEYFQLRPIKSAKVSEISEATSVSSVPAKDRVNFHIGHPVQDERLSRLYFQLVSGLDSPIGNKESEEEITRLEVCGWERDQKEDLQFILNTIEKSTPYLPRGGYSSQTPGKIIEFLKEWLVEGQPEPLAYSFGEKSSPRECMLNTGGIWESLRVFLWALSAHLIHSPAHIFLHQVNLPSHLYEIENLKFKTLDRDEHKSFDSIEKLFESQSNLPAYIILGAPLSEAIRIKLRDLSLRIPLRFVEINQTFNHLSLAREAQMQNGVLRILSASVLSSKFSQLSVDFILGSSDLINVMETTQFELKGTPSVTEIELLVHLLESKKSNTHPSRNQISPIEGPRYTESLKQSKTFDSYISTRLATIDQVVENIQQAITISDHSLETFQKHENFIRNKIQIFPPIKTATSDLYSSMRSAEIVNHFYKNIDHQEWLSTLSENFVQSFAKHHPEYSKDHLIVVSGSARTALSLLGFHCGFREAVTADLGWTYEHCFPQLKTVPLTSNFTLDVKGMIKIIEDRLITVDDWKKQGVVILNNPHNASGHITEKDKLKPLIKYCLENDVYLIDDLSYQKVLPEPSINGPQTIRQIASDLVKDGYISSQKLKHLITVHSLSKTDCFAGARLSVVEIIDPYLRDLFRTLNKGITPNHLAILLAYLFYRNDSEGVNSFWLLRNIIFSERMSAMEKAAGNLPEERNPYALSLHRPQGSMYPRLIINNLPKGLSLDWLSSNLATRGIGLIPLTTFARTSEGFEVARKSFRLTLGGAENLESVSKKMRRLMIDLNHLIANEEARYNLKRIKKVKRSGLSQINFSGFDHQWNLFTDQIISSAKISLNMLLRKYSKFLDHSTDYNLLFEKYFSSRLSILHQHLKDQMEEAEDLFKIAKSELRQTLIAYFENEISKDNIDNRLYRFRKRLFDRTVHPTQMYSLKVDIQFQKIVEGYLISRSFSENEAKKTGMAIVREFIGLDVPISSIDEADELVLDLKSQIAGEKLLQWSSSNNSPLLLSFWGDWDGSNRPSGQGHRLIAAAVMENLTQLAKLLNLLTRYDKTIDIDPELQREINHLPENRQKFWNLLNQITRLTNQLEKRYHRFIPLELSFGVFKRMMMRFHLFKDPLTALWQHNNRLEKRMLAMRQQRRDSLEYYFSLNKRLRKMLHTLLPQLESQLHHPEIAIAFGSYRDLLKRFALSPRIHQRIITSEDPFTIDTTVHNMIELNEISGKFGNPGMVMALQVSMSTEPEAFIQLDRKIRAERESRLREDPESTIPPIWIIPLFEDVQSIEKLQDYLDRLWSYATQSRKIDQAQADRFKEMVCEIFIAGSDLSQQVGQAAAASLYGKAKFITMRWLAERGLVEEIRMKYGCGESMQRQGGYYNLDSENDLFLKSRDNKKRMNRYLKESSVKSIDFAKSPLQGVLASGDMRTFQSTISERLRFLSVTDRANLYYHLAESQKFHDDELVRISEPQINTRLQFKERGLEELESFICGNSNEIYADFLKLCTKNFRQILYGSEEDVVGIHVISHFISRALPELRDRPTVRPGGQMGKARGQQIIERLAQTLPMCKHGSMLRAIGHNRAQSMVLGINQLTTGLFRSLKEFADQYSGSEDGFTLLGNRILPQLPVREILQTLFYYHDPTLEYLREMEKAYPAGNSSFLFIREDTDSISPFIGLFQKEYLRRFGLDINDFFNGNVFNPELLPVLRPEIAVLMQEDIFNSDPEQFFMSITGKVEDVWQDQVRSALRFPETIKLWRKQIWSTLRAPIYGQVNSFVELAQAIDTISRGSGQSLKPVTSDLSEIIRLGSHIARKLRGTGDDSLRQFLTDVVQLLTQLPGTRTEIPVDIIRALRDVERIVQIEEQVLSGKEQDIERFYLLQIARLTGENG
jgi:aspartate/methionine/tyrosine aminotransferase